jgi:carbon storage regulator
MLVLSRRTGEQIVLPEAGVTVTVLGVSGKRVRLGVEAPANATVHRAEVWRRILDLLPSKSNGRQEPQPCCELSAR